MTDIGKLATEQRNAASEHIDRLPTLDMVRLIDNEDKKVAGAVETVCPAYRRSPLTAFTHGCSAAGGSSIPAAAHPAVSACLTPPNAPRRTRPTRSASPRV